MISVLVIIGIWYLATHGKGNVAARLVAWLLALIIGVVVLAFSDPRLAASAVTGFASGITQAASSVAKFFRQS